MSSVRDWVPSLWSDTFSEMCEEELDCEDYWAFQFNYGLADTLSTEERRRGWKIYSHSAYGQFRCGSCSKFWCSARTVLLFWYRLRGGSERGTVLMRPFGQACRRCRDQFEFPGFSEEEVEEALLRLFGKIRKNCYGEEEEEEEDGESVGSEHVRTRPHESALCEACQQGICSKE